MGRYHHMAPGKSPQPSALSPEPSALFTPHGRIPARRFLRASAPRFSSRLSSRLTAVTSWPDVAPVGGSTARTSASASGAGTGPVSQRSSFLSLKATSPKSKKAITGGGDGPWLRSALVGVGYITPLTSAG